jgi:hypothetical protein
MRRESISTRIRCPRLDSEDAERTQNGRTSTTSVRTPPGIRYSLPRPGRPRIVRDNFYGPAGSRVHHHVSTTTSPDTSNTVQYIQPTMSVSAVVSHVARRARGRAVSLARLFSTAEFDSVSSSVSAHSPVGGASGGLGHGHGHAGRTQGDRGSFASGSRGFGRRFATNSHGTYTSVLSVLSVAHSLAHSLARSLAPTSHQTS